MEHPSGTSMTDELSLISNKTYITNFVTDLSFVFEQVRMHADKDLYQYAMKIYQKK